MATRPGTAGFHPFSPAQTRQPMRKQNWEETRPPPGAPSNDGSGAGPRHTSGVGRPGAEWVSGGSAGGPCGPARAAPGRAPPLLPARRPSGVESGDAGVRRLRFEGSPPLHARSTPALPGPRSGGPLLSACCVLGTSGPLTGRSCGEQSGGVRGRRGRRPDGAEIRACPTGGLPSGAGLSPGRVSYLERLSSAVRREDGLLLSHPPAGQGSQTRAQGLTQTCKGGAGTCPPPRPPTRRNFSTKEVERVLDSRGEKRQVTLELDSSVSPQTLSPHFLF
ncbi:collagen alpha-1(III) chain-like isoform X1 [Canis lupus familiaris]|uniref:collagen alpha-1(III) chain-like isoform X1 n=1 Tax=Canis lupus familiaris TaxID=9615 RepID=UPI0018F7DC70|nr:collagen alpha-1(III) chain-like isoform X1 [Canis lupus familiaris]